MQTQIKQLMTSSGVKFGTSGARGLVVDMSDFVCFAYTIAFLQYAVQDSSFDRVAVGCDLRSSSPRIVRAVCRAVQHLGLKPIDCGALPSPALALYGLTEQIPTVMVTGSHIPEDRNGIKFNLPDGEILKKDESGIQSQTVDIPDELFDSDGMLKPEETRISTESDGGEAKQRYIDRFLRALPKKYLSGFRIGLYEHSAVGRDLLFELFTTLGATVTRLGRSDTFISVDTEAVRDEDLRLARSWASGVDLPDGVKGTPENPPFDAIFSTDGDSDRPLVFDEHGEWIRGDVTGIIASRFCLADCVVTPVSSSTALERSGWFTNIVRTKIGSPYVIEAMQQAMRCGCERVVGYEANGGFLTATPILLEIDDCDRTLGPLPTRDPAFVHIACLAFGRMIGVPLSEIRTYLPRRVVMSDRLQDFPPELSRQKMDELQSGGEDMLQLVFAVFGELQSVDRTDGLRMTFGDQDIVHLRPSGNAPEMRCYTEADTRDRAALLLRETMAILDGWRQRTRNDTSPYRQ